MLFRSKANPDPVIGLDGLAAMLAAATVPAVALGGVDLDNVRDVLAAGARNVCAVRAVNRSARPERELARFAAIVSEARPGRAPIL